MRAHFDSNNTEAALAFCELCFALGTLGHCSAGDTAPLNSFVADGSYLVLTSSGTREASFREGFHWDNWLVYFFIDISVLFCIPLAPGLSLFGYDLQ